MEIFTITKHKNSGLSGRLIIGQATIYLTIGMKIEYFKEDGLFAFLPDGVKGNFILRGGSKTNSILSEIKKYV